MSATSGSSEAKSTTATTGTTGSAPSTEWTQIAGPGPVEDIAETDDGFVTLMPSESTRYISGRNVDECLGIELVEVDACGVVCDRTTVGWEGRQYPNAFVRTDDGYVVGGESVVEREGGDERWGFVVGVGWDGEVRWRTDVGVAINDVVATSDGGYVAVGIRSDDQAEPSREFTAHGLVVRVGIDGRITSTRAYPKHGTALQYEELQSVVETDDGGLVLAGQMAYETWLFAVGPDGEVRWSSGPSESDEGRATELVRTSDGGYAVTGTLFDGGTGSFLWKVDENGYERWLEMYHSDIPDPVTVVETENGYALAGYGGYVSGTDASGHAIVDEGGYLLGTDTSGEKQWSVAGTDGVGFSLLTTSDGGLLSGGWGGLQKFSRSDTEAKGTSAVASRETPDTETEALSGAETSRQNVANVTVQQNATSSTVESTDVANDWNDATVVSSVRSLLRSFGF